jgi:hypothetical protein
MFFFKIRGFLRKIRGVLNQKKPSKIEGKKLFRNYFFQNFFSYFGAG